MQSTCWQERLHDLGFVSIFLRSSLWSAPSPLQEMVERYLAPLLVLRARIPKVEGARSFALLPQHRLEARFMQVVSGPEVLSLHPGVSAA